MEQVIPLYMEQTDLLTYRALITKVGHSEIDKKRQYWVQLNETIFHPKGGGQPCDEGTINSIKVIHVHKEIKDKSRLDQFEILHCLDEAEKPHFKEGDEVELKVDGRKRLLYSRLHTAGHLIAEAVNTLYPCLQAYQGNHYPGNSFVRFKLLDSALDDEKEVILQKVQLQLREWIEKDFPVLGRMQPTGIRSVNITQNWMPCGGTHVESLKRIGQVEITDLSINKKEGTVTVKYQVE